jgi:glycosyltransferase involved in cell wall biosynthesis
MINNLNKTVACVIPCYGYANYLEECVSSVVNQTCPLNEIIIVNDGSKDNTSEVARKLIEKYPQSNIKLVEKENGGLSSARNAGIKVSTSDFIFCLDADDKIVPGSTEEHIRLMDNDETIAQCALMQFGQFHNIHVPQGANYDRLLYGNTVFCNAMFSKKAWEKSRCGFDEHPTMRLGLEDYLFWLDLTSQGCKVNTSDFIALRYRQHDNNMTSKTTHPNWSVILAYMRGIHPLLKAK